MKLLVDACISKRVVIGLQAAGHDATWVGDLPGSPPDSDILALAHGQRRVVVTLDKDFAELAIRTGAPHSGIIRMVEMPRASLLETCARALTRYAADLERGAIVVVTQGNAMLRMPG